MVLAKKRRRENYSRGLLKGVQRLRTRPTAGRVRIPFRAVQAANSPRLLDSGPSPVVATTRLTTQRISVSQHVSGSHTPPKEEPHKSSRLLCSLFLFLQTHSADSSFLIALVLLPPLCPPPFLPFSRHPLYSSRSEWFEEVCFSQKTIHSLAVFLLLVLDPLLAPCSWNHRSERFVGWPKGWPGLSQPHQPLHR